MTSARILVVEDEPEMAAAITRSLQSYGYETVGPCTNAEAALHLAAADRPDLALMDVNLAHDDDGVMAAETLREKLNVRSVIVTALPIEHVLPRAERASPVGFLSKPFNARQLQTTIEMALHLKSAQAQLQDSRQTLTAMLQAAADGLIVMDRSGRILEMNEAACRLSTRSRAELIGRNICNLCPEVGESLAEFNAGDREASEGSHAVHTWINSVGRHVEITLCVTSDTAATDRYVCFARDITARRQNEELVRKLSRAVEQSPVSIVITDDRGLIEYVNPRFELVTGYSAREVLGKNPRLLKSGTQSSEFYKQLWETISGGHEWRGEFHNLRKNGELYWESASISPVRDHTGQISHYIAVKEDITDRKIAARDLERMNAELKAAIARTRELAHAASAANRAKTAFLASMSHELRTPLNVINGVSATMIRQFAGTKPADSAALILECGEHLLGIISEILDLSVLEGNRAKLDTRTFNLLTVVSAALRKIAVPAREKALSLSWWIAPGTPLDIESDPRRLQQILINLLQNAVKFTERGGVHLSVSAVGLGGGTWRWSFVVTDSGIGLSPEQAGRLFEPFVQATGDICRTYGGTGLGLAISRSLARLMGGDLVVHSVPGRGSSFRCCVIATSSAVPQTLASLAPGSAQGVTVRIAVSDARCRRLLMAVTHSWGMRPSLNGAQRPTDGANGAAELVISDNDAGRLPSASEPVIWIGRLDESGTPGHDRAVLQSPLDLTELRRALETALCGDRPKPVPPSLQQSDAPLGERVPLRILAADDLRTNREVLRGMLQHLGYTPEFRANGAEVLSAVAENPYDLVLLDVQMPVMDGLAAARELCRLMPDPARRPKLIALTANALAGDRDRCLAAGMDDYLSKPVLPDQLENCIVNHFGHMTQRASTTYPRLSTNAAGERPLLDEAHLRAAFHMLGRQPVGDALKDMEEIVRGDYEAARPRVAEACNRQDSSELASILHALKGCFLSIGWARLAHTCAAKLAEVREQKFTEWRIFPAQLEALFQESRAAFGRYVEQHSKPGTPSSKL